VRLTTSGLDDPPSSWCRASVQAPFGVRIQVRCGGKGFRQQYLYRASKIAGMIDRRRRTRNQRAGDGDEAGNHFVCRALFSDARRRNRSPRNGPTFRDMHYPTGKERYYTLPSAYLRTAAGGTTLKWE